jgi:hypothetical protein
MIKINTTKVIVPYYQPLRMRGSAYNSDVERNDIGNDDVLLILGGNEVNIIVIIENPSVGRNRQRPGYPLMEFWRDKY